MLDLVIRDALVVDGTGRPARRASVAVNDGLIAAVSDDLSAARRVIDAERLVLAPGIIDTHPLRPADHLGRGAPSLARTWRRHDVTGIFGRIQLGARPVELGGGPGVVSDCRSMAGVPSGVAVAASDGQSLRFDAR